MVQEVQQQGNRYQTPNEIQGIGDIRRRVKEHTQVTAKFSSKCQASWKAIGEADSWLWPRIKGTLTWSSWGGQMEFKEVNWGIRIPRAGIYKITIDAEGALYGDCYHYMRTGNTPLFYAYTPRGHNTATATEIVNLGKYTILEYRVRVYYENVTTNQKEFCNITITQL